MNRFSNRMVAAALAALLLTSASAYSRDKQPKKKKNTDLSASRNFPLHFREGARVAFRTEFFNLFNRPQLGQPNGTIGNRTFGRITSTTSAPRILQLSLKVEF